MAKRSKEVSQEIAIKTNVTKWTNAIEKQSGGTAIYETLGVDADVWKNLHSREQWDIISEFKKGKDFKLERNKRTINYQELLDSLANTKEGPEREVMFNLIKRVSEYNKAKVELENAQSNYEKAKTKLANAKEKVKNLEEIIEKANIV